MLRSRRILHSAPVAVLSVLLLSCGGAHDSDEYFVLVSANLQVPYWKAAGAGFSNAAGQMKVRSDFMGPQTYDPKAERDAVDQAVQKKATGILLGVTDPALLKDSIDKAVAAGVPVVTIDSDAPSSKRLFFIGTNNYQAGFTGGERLAQELKGKGNVVAFIDAGSVEPAGTAPRLQRGAGQNAGDQDYARGRYSGRPSHRIRYDDTDHWQGARQGRRLRLPGSAIGQRSRRRTRQLIT